MKKYFYVLIIEDEERLALQTKEMLNEKCPFISKIKIVENGEIGLKEIKRKMPDCIIVNQYMPKMTGLEMIEKAKQLELNLPLTIVLTGGLKSNIERKKFCELGIDYIFVRPFNDIREKEFIYFIEKAYKTSTKIEKRDMIRLIEKQTKPLLDNLAKYRVPYQVRLVAHMLQYLIENNLEYSKLEKQKIYEYYKQRDNLKDEDIKGIQDCIEGIIEENYTLGNPIRKMNYQINKDDIQEEFFHNLKENVLKDIIAESN